jgi:hypothetical protein
MTKGVLKTFALPLMAAFLTLCLAVAGCGGDSDSESQPTTLSKAQYIKRADEICKKTEKRQRKLLTQYSIKNNGTPETPQTTEKVISYAALPPVQEEIDELKKLPAPEEEAAKAKAYIESLEKGLEAAEREPGTLLAEPGAFSKAEEASRAFGFKTCRGA